MNMNSGAGQASAKTPASRWSENNRRRWSSLIFDMKTVLYSSDCQKMLITVQLLVHIIFKCKKKKKPQPFQQHLSGFYFSAGWFRDCGKDVLLLVFQLQPVLQWISQLHLFKGRAARVQQLLFALRSSRCSASTCTAPSTLKSLPQSLLHKVSGVISLFISSA